MLLPPPLRHRSLCFVFALWVSVASAHDAPAAPAVLQFRIVIPPTVVFEYVPQVLAFLAPVDLARLMEQHPGMDIEVPAFRVGPALSSVNGQWVLPGRARRLGSRRVGHTFVLSVQKAPHRMYTVSSP